MTADTVSSLDCSSPLHTWGRPLVIGAILVQFSEGRVLVGSDDLKSVPSVLHFFRVELSQQVLQQLSILVESLRPDSVAPRQPGRELQLSVRLRNLAVVFVAREVAYVALVCQQLKADSSTGSVEVLLEGLRVAIGRVQGDIVGLLFPFEGPVGSRLREESGKTQGGEGDG